MIYKAVKDYLNTIYKPHEEVVIYNITIEKEFKIEVFFRIDDITSRYISLKLLYEIYIDINKNLKTIKIGVYDCKKTDTKQKT